MTSFPTILSGLQAFSDGQLPSGNASSLHQFSVEDSKLQGLRAFTLATSQLSAALSSHLSHQIPEQRHVAKLRQHTLHASKLFLDQQAARNTSKALQLRKDSQYAEDVPLERVLLPTYLLSRIKHWGKAASMDIFEEDATGTGRKTLILAGKSLVIDLDVHVEDSIISLASVKVSHASTIESNAMPTCSTTQGALIKRQMDMFIQEIQKNDIDVDCTKAAEIGSRVIRHLIYLMKLDFLSATDGGSKWFDLSGTVASRAENLMEMEAMAIAQSLESDHAPLDVFLNRAHGLPLPYLENPALTFLIHLSPLTYLTLSRSRDDRSKTLFDISMTSIRDHIEAKLYGGITSATLSLTSGDPFPYYAPALPSNRPSFNLLPHDVAVYEFPQANAGGNSWVLDFGLEGVVIAQSRMREISMVVGTCAPHDPPSTGLPYQTGPSWVDMLLNPLAGVPSLRYVSIYKSPNGSHPDLHNTLIPSREPGFILGKVKVLNLKHVWGVMEIVKEQCWLNEVLRACRFYPTGLTTANMNHLGMFEGPEVVASIPVVYSLGERAEPVISISFPTKADGANLTKVEVRLDPTKPRGVCVEANGIRRDGMEEVVRRGGICGLAGKLWRL